MMISCLDSNDKPVYISKLEDFRELMSADTYSALSQYLDEIHTEVEVNTSDYEYELAEADDRIDELEDEVNNLENSLDECKEVIYFMLNRLYNKKEISYDELEGFIDREEVYLELDYAGSDIYKEDYQS